jgi:hypothetical protein
MPSGLIMQLVGSWPGALRQQLRLTCLLLLPAPSPAEAQGWPEGEVHGGCGGPSEADLALSSADRAAADSRST